MYIHYLSFSWAIELRRVDKSESTLSLNEVATYVLGVCFCCPLQRNDMCCGGFDKVISEYKSHPESSNGYELHV